MAISVFLSYHLSGRRRRNGIFTELLMHYPDSLVICRKGNPNCLVWNRTSYHLSVDLRVLNRCFSRNKNSDCY